jgi:hypothetical protein
VEQSIWEGNSLARAFRSLSRAFYRSWKIDGRMAAPEGPRLSRKYLCNPAIAYHDSAKDQIMFYAALFGALITFVGDSNQGK